MASLAYVDGVVLVYGVAGDLPQLCVSLQELQVRRCAHQHHH